MSLSSYYNWFCKVHRSKMREVFIILLCLQFCVILECAIFPKGVKKCHFGDTECIKNSANELIRNYPQGIPAIGLKPLDVVPVKDVVLVNDSQVGVTWYFFQLVDQINYGFENTTITEINGFDKDPTSTQIVVKGVIPRVIYKGNYNAKGRMLWMVDINSTGKSESEFLNFFFEITLKVLTEYRNNKRYLKIYQLVPNIGLDRWVQWLENFFPENTDLTIAINKLFNANWVEFWNELEKPILECQILPKSIKKCHYGDSKCIIESMNNVIKHYPKGIPAIGLKPTDVVDIQDVELWNENVGFFFEFRLFNQVNYGFENTTITQVKGFNREPTATTMEIHGRVPSLIHKGNYIANGRIWLLKVNSTGESYTDFQNFRFTLKLKVIMEYRNNTRYLKIYELVPTINMKRWILWLEDFFKENTDLTLFVNKVFNENCINDLIRSYPKGIPEIGLPPLDATALNDIPILDSPYRGPIWLTFYIRDTVNKGFNNATVTHVAGFNRDPRMEKIVIKARIPRVIHEATYDMQGQVMFLKSNTTGKLESDFQNIHVTLTFKIILEYRNQKRYLRIYDLVPVVSLDRWIIRLDNLYKENIDLTFVLNRVFNEHWVELWNDLEPGLMKVFALSFSSMLNQVFENVAYDDMFLPD
ncbi:hypothetical protein ACLKA7_010396 [Drosophila subpalustris]